MAVEKEPPVSIKKVVKDDRFFKISGFFWILVSVWMGIALVSYCFTWKLDQDKVFSSGIVLFSSGNVKFANQLGSLGAWVGHQLVYKGFGLAAFFLCSIPFVAGVNLIFGKIIFRPWRNFFYSLTGLLFFSIALAFLLKGFEFSFGGGTGEWIDGYLEGLLGKTGTGLLLVVAGLAWIIWRFNPTFHVPKVPAIQWPQKSQEKPAVFLQEDALDETIGAPSEAAFFEHPSLTKATEAPQPLVGALTINDLYAQGKTPKKFEVAQESVDPLKVQPVVGGENTLAQSEGLIVVVPPLPHPIVEDNPLIQFSIIEAKQEDNFTEQVSPQPVTPTKELENNTVSIIVPPAYASPTPVETTLPVEVIERQLHAAVLDGNPTGFDLEIKPSALETNQKAEGTKGSNNPSAVELTPYDPFLELSGYQYPSLDLLETHGSEKIVTDASELETHKNQIINTLKNYDIQIQRIAATVGPTVTLYEIVPAPGVRISRIKNLEDDIALSLAALGIRIIAPIPGKGTIGIEVPNIRKTIVSMRTLLASEKFQNSNFSLPIAIGKKIDNEHFVVDLASMPHLLMAGATGQGKSVGINAVLVSLLYKKHPSQLKLVLVDPKKVELSLYRVIERHFLAKLPGEEEAIITDTKKVVHTLNALCIEMDNRYDLLKEAGVRNIKEYNEKFIKRRLSPEKGHQFLPFIVLVVDEFADLIMTAGKEIEMPIARLAQLARAVGIHLIIATQRPSVNIITGTIKANFPSRIAYKVSSKIDSRTILDAGGAEQLIGKGDMLISHNGELIRLQCAFVDTPEVERVCDAIGNQRGYPDAFLLPEYVDEKELEGKDFDLSDRDTLFEDAARLIVQHQMGSTSLIQRRMKLGYNRAGRLMDQLEKAGIVGPNLGSKARDVLIASELDLEDILSRI